MNCWALACIFILGLAWCDGGEINSEQEDNKLTLNQNDVGKYEDRNTTQDLDSGYNQLNRITRIQHDLQGRGKKYKYLMGLLGTKLLIKLAILPIALGFLKLLTGKALLVTLMALMLITVVTLKKSGGSGSRQPQVSLF